jgi:hypothetical protein
MVGIVLEESILNPIEWSFGTKFFVACCEVLATFSIISNYFLD